MSVNVKAEKVVFNDLMWQVPEMLQEFKKIGVEESLRKIDGYISSYDLSKENKEGYLALRELDLDTLGENDFVYCDPPYLITVASYNENGGWGEQAERDLLAKLDTLDKAGVKFGLSNVFESKGKENIILKEWAKGYKVHYLDHTYSNCSYHKKDKQSKDIEVFITNY